MWAGRRKRNSSLFFCLANMRTIRYVQESTYKKTPKTIFSRRRSFCFEFVFVVPSPRAEHWSVFMKSFLPPPLNGEEKRNFSPFIQFRLQLLLQPNRPHSRFLFKTGDTEKTKLYAECPFLFKCVFPGSLLALLCHCCKIKTREWEKRNRNEISDSRLISLCAYWSCLTYIVFSTNFVSFVAGLPGLTLKQYAYYIRT